MEEELGLCRADTEASWDVLRDYGNLSSASVLFILNEWLAQEKCRGESRAAGGVRPRFQRGDAAAAMDLSVIAYIGLLALVGLERLAELAISRRHQQRRKQRASAKSRTPFRLDGGAARGVLIAAGVEVLLLHRPLIPVLAIPMAVLFVCCHCAALVGDSHAGAHWNVEVMASPQCGVVSSGPFRWVRHPNYLGVFWSLWRCP